MVNGVFSGDSMFHKEKDVSKLALLELIEHLKSLGLTWIDMQMVSNDFVKRSGAKYIPVSEFLTRLMKSEDIKWFNPL